MHRTLALRAPAGRRPEIRKARFEQLEQRTLLSIGAASGPSIAGITPTLDDGLLPTTTESLTIEYGEPVVGGDEAANYRLQRLGPDALLGTADDEIVPLASVAYSDNTATLTFDPLVQSVYRLTVLDEVADVTGLRLDGNGDGVEGGNWAREFVVDLPGSPLFGPSTTLPTSGYRSEWVAVGDFDGDGHDDLAVADRGEDLVGGTVEVFSGDGTGAFGEHQVVSLGNFPGGPIAAGDLNNDGKCDLVVGSQMGSATVAVLLSAGDDGFADPMWLNMEGGMITRVAIADFNGDNIQDLVVGSFSPPNSGLSVVRVLFGDGSGGFPDEMTLDIGGRDLGDLAMGDFNGDGQTDLAAAECHTGKVAVLLNVDGTFPNEIRLDTLGDTAVTSSVGDFNGDGHEDLMAFTDSVNGINLEVFLGDGLGGFSDPLVSGPSWFFTTVLTVADFNLDGHSDVACATMRATAPAPIQNGLLAPVSSNWLGVALSDGAGRFQDFSTFSFDGMEPRSMAAADFDGDGRIDLAVASMGDPGGVPGSIATLQNTYSPSPVVLTSPRGYVFDLDTADLGVGQLLQGTDNAADGLNRLEVDGKDYRVGVSTPWLNETERTLVTPEVVLAGLNVHREITVPETGDWDFARTIDTFHNPTGLPITTTVRFAGNFGFDAATTVWNTSDGDALVETTDEWIAVDNGLTAPAMVEYFGAGAGLQPNSVELVGDNIVWQYEVTIPPGDNVRLAHMTILAETRPAAEAAAAALVGPTGLSDQAAVFLTERERNSIANFDGEPPALVGISPSPDDGTLPEGTASLAIKFSESVSGGDEAANYRLRHLGRDALLGTADDEIVPLASVAYSDNTATLTFDALAESVYRLTISDTITDLVGHRLDGSGDGTPGGDWAVDFVVDLPEHAAFTPAASIAPPFDDPRWLATGDFNGDGNLDLAVSDRRELGADGMIGVYLRDAQGLFSEFFSFPLCNFSGGPMAAGDLDNDGKADLVVGDSRSASAAVFLGAAHGGLTEPVRFVTDSELASTTSLAIADFDGDGNLDLAVGGVCATPSLYAVRILTGDGTGRFSDPVTVSSAGELIVAGDFFGEGQAGLAVVGPQNVELVASDGSGSFDALYQGSSGGLPASVAAGDFNRDGVDELAWSHVGGHTVRELLRRSVPEERERTMVVEKEGRLEFRTMKELRWVLVSEMRELSLGMDYPVLMIIDDFDGDGSSELAAVCSNGAGEAAGIQVYFEHGFNGRVTLPLDGPFPAAVAAADFDGDGRTDLAMVADGLVTVLENSCVPHYVTLAGPNGFEVDVDVTNWGAGQLLQGPAETFDGFGRLQVGGLDYALGSTIPWLNESQNGLTTPDVAVAGLRVHREIALLGQGSEDFVRTLDVFHNPSDASITTTVRIAGNLGSDTTVWNTSDGDTLVETTDEWIATDDADGSGNPPVVHYLHGATGLQPGSVELVGDNLTWQYEITVPAGYTVRLAHLTVFGETRSAVETSALTLVGPDGFAPEATAQLDDEERESILNFPSTPPAIIATTPSLVAGVLPEGTDSLLIEFDEQVLGADLAGNIELCHLGADALLGTPDDPIVPVSLVVYSGTAALLSFDPLPEGVYRLTISRSITDLLGNRLDGDANGTAGVDWVRDFVVDVPQGPLLTSLGTFDSGGVRPASILVEDFNGDGLDDLAVCHLGEPGAGGTVVVFSGDGSGGFVDPATFDLNGFSGGPMAAGDLNNDGETDLAIGNSEGQTLTLLLGSGDGRFADPVMVDTWGESPQAVEIVDLDGDKNADLRVTQARPGEDARTVAYYNDGAAGFSGPVFLGYPYGLSVSWDLDGIDEDFWVQLGGNTVEAVYTVTKLVWETRTREVVIDGTVYTVDFLVWKPVFETRARTIHFNETRPHFLVIEDFTGDGLDDLVAVGTTTWAGGIESTVVKAVWEGPDSINRSVVLLESPLPTSVATGDFNGDGKGDLVMADRDGNSVEVLLNTISSPAATMYDGAGYTFDVDRTAWGAGQLLQLTDNAADGLNRLQVGGFDYEEVTLPAGTRTTR